jgi:hypothetical protein
MKDGDRDAKNEKTNARRFHEELIFCLTLTYNEANPYQPLLEYTTLPASYF